MYDLNKRTWLADASIKSWPCLCHKITPLADLMRWLAG